MRKRIPNEPIFARDAAMACAIQHIIPVFSLRLSLTLNTNTYTTIKNEIKIFFDSIRHNPDFFRTSLRMSLRAKAAKPSFFYKRFSLRLYLFHAKNALFFENLSLKPSNSILFRLFIQQLPLGSCPSVRTARYHIYP